MKQYSISLDERADEALRRASMFLGLSRSEIIRRLALLADAAVFGGVQKHLNTVSDPEELRKLAEAGCDEWGLTTLGSRWQSSEAIGALRAVSSGE
jgi:hypothetical protein